MTGTPGSSGTGPGAAGGPATGGTGSGDAAGTGRPGGIEITVQERVGWNDTDAGGHHHHTSIARYVEVAEAALYRRIGEPQLMALVPRVEYHAEYLSRLYYQDAVDVTLRVASLGRTSLTYEFEVRRADDGTIAARGGFVVVHIADIGEKSEPWPDHLRAALLGGSA